MHVLFFKNVSLSCKNQPIIQSIVSKYLTSGGEMDQIPAHTRPSLVLSSIISLSQSLNTASSAGSGRKNIHYVTIRDRSLAPLPEYHSG